ncbi:precorrin-3B synthase [Streptomyces albospinus]|uniref:Precorrin-3B synthase n=1 Tax=Streptomyces albospinus TaxID=285515 RepID=A0ABQ2V0U9_9ACTN|nr:precorrin-3B synthase [Streptomyces albospinus]GGU59309.1 precorrin-3B synthase [Streptomyces albospinus]
MLAAMPPSPAPLPHGTEPPVRDRGDACPGALRLHSAADGRLARVRLPAGDLTVRQATALADAAERLGDGHLSLTSRGNAELRGLPDGCGRQLADLLADAGLLPSVRHERIRNIVASPLAGLDRYTPPDVRLWARGLDALLCASTAATGLSGRFLFVLDDGRGDVAGLGGDVTLIAEPGNAAPGIAESAGESTAGAASGRGALLRVGDDPAVLRIAGEDVPRAALTAAETFLTAAAASGSGAWRVRELPADRALTAREVARALRAAGIAAEYKEAAEYTEYAGYAGYPEYAAEAPAPPYADSGAPGLVDGADGRRALAVLAPLGRLTVTQWRALTGIAASDGAGELRLTPWRGIVLPGLPAATAPSRLRELAAAGLITDPASPWHRLSACIGRPGCAKSLTDVRADVAAALAADTSAPTGGAGLPVHWSGCARRCGHPHGTWVDVVATPDGYRTTVVRPEDPAPSPVARETPRPAPVSRETAQLPSVSWESAAPEPVSRETPPAPGPSHATPGTPQPTTTPRPQ